jgi:MFS family permease
MGQQESTQSKMGETPVLGVAVLAGFVALAVAMGIGRFAFTPLLPMMEDDAGLTVADGGWLAAANYVGYLIGAIAALGHRIAPVVAIRVGLVATGLVTLAMGFTDSFPAWLALRALAGMASAWALIFASAWCLEILARSDRRGLSGVVFGGVGAGIAFTGLVCAALMAADARSYEGWIVLGAVALIATLAIWPAFGFASTRMASARSPAVPSGRFRWTAEAIRLALCYGAFGTAYIIPATFLPVMAKAALGDPALFRWSWPIFGAASLVGTIAAARWQSRVGNRRLWQVTHLAMAVGVALPVLPLGFTGIVLGSLLVGGGFMITTMAAIGEARDVGGAHAERFIAAMTAAFAIGQIVGPLAVSALVSRLGTFTPALIAASALLVVSSAGLMRGFHPTAAATVSSGGEQ